LGLPNNAAPPEPPTILNISLIRNDKGDVARRLRYVSRSMPSFASLHISGIAINQTAMTSPRNAEGTRAT
jgi:hypothetical protein